MVLTNITRKENKKMEELQIYDIVNSVTSQALGRTDLTVVNDQSLIALGRTVLDSATYTDDFINTLVKRIGKTIVSFRSYRNAFNSLMKDQIEWGAIVQKIKVDMPAAETDQSYDLTNGASVDHYKVAKPTVKQKLFITDTPYQFKVTIQRVHLQEAFTSASAMGSFISAVFGEVQNAIELALENLGRTSLNNYMAELFVSDGVAGPRVYNLRTLYNANVPEAEQIADSKNCLTSEKFLRFAIGKIKDVSKKMRAMSVIYNDGTVTRHTPLEMQKLFVLSEFETALETQVEYAAFNEQYVKLDGFEEVPYWQDIKTPFNIKIGRASDNTEINGTNIVACVFDTDALGMFTKESWTSTTPFNAAGGYTNTFWHEKQLWFNDLSENFVMFTLN